MHTNTGVNLLVGYLLLIAWTADLASTDGNVGCFFNINLCERDENCSDDNAFGRCVNMFDSEPDEYQYALDSNTMQLLEKELTRLLTGGYRWDNDYTQCVVQNILYSLRHGVSYDPGLCSRIMHMTVPNVTPQMLSQLQAVDPKDLALIKFSPERSDATGYIYADETFTPPMTKEDKKKKKKKEEEEVGEEEKSQVRREIVKKRDPKKLFDEDLEETSVADGNALFRRLLDAAKDTEKLLNVEEDFASKLPSNEMSVVETDLSSDLNHHPIFSEGGMQWLPIAKDSEGRRSGFEEVPSDNQQDVETSEDSVPFKFNERKRAVMDLTLEKSRNDQVFKLPTSRRGYEDPDEDSNFQWNWKHFNPLAESNVLDNYGVMLGKQDEPEPIDLNYAANDQTDYQTDDFPALLQREQIPEFTLFDRAMRYDTKKPGPNNFLHDDEDGVSDEDLADVFQGDVTKEDSFISNLKEKSHRDQLQNLFNNQRRSKLRLTSSMPGFTEVQDERLNEVIHLHISPEPPQDNGPEESKNDTDQESGVKRTIQTLPMTQGLYPYSVLGKPIIDMGDMMKTDRTSQNDDLPGSTKVSLNIEEKDATQQQAAKLVDTLENLMKLPPNSFINTRLGQKQVTFQINPDYELINASEVATQAESLSPKLKEFSKLSVSSVNVGDKVVVVDTKQSNDRTLFILTFVLCGSVVGVSLVAAVVFIIRRHARSKEKLQNIAQPDTEASQDYQDLCRQRMASKTNEATEGVVHTTFSPKKVRSLSQGEGAQVSSSSHSSTSSWNEEPVTSNMDISTGHMILSYMEDHLKTKDRLEREWEAMCAYEAEPCLTNAAILPQNAKKNRYPDILPYDHSRVVLNEQCNVSGSDYINACSITDHDPRNPAYIATQGPLPHTAADFWQMIWEQGSVVMVMLTRLMENGVAMCHRHWPEEGSEVYHIYEVHLVSEHIWCDDYLVRSFYLKNLKTGETRTVTQFHFLSWPDNGVPNSTKALLEFRRKVNKSYRGRSCPIVVHCSDGIGRTGTYILIDMVLNRMSKGAKEIDIAATLEHVRDQRVGMVKTKTQFEFVLMAIAEEVHAILRALAQ